MNEKKETPHLYPVESAERPAINNAGPATFSNNSPWLRSTTHVYGIPPRAARKLLERAGKSSARHIGGENLRGPRENFRVNFASCALVLGQRRVPSDDYSFSLVGFRAFSLVVREIDSAYAEGFRCGFARSRCYVFFTMKRGALEN